MLWVKAHVPERGGQYLNYIKELGLKDTLLKRERSTQLDFPTNISLMPPISTWKGEGFYVELFLICAFLLE